MREPLGNRVHDAGGSALDSHDGVHPSSDASTIRGKDAQLEFTIERSTPLESVNVSQTHRIDVVRCMTRNTYDVITVDWQLQLDMPIEVRIICHGKKRTDNNVVK